MNHNEILNAISTVITGQEMDDVIPVLITASARALATDANGDIGRLSIALLKFCRLVENEATDMLGY